MYVYDPGTDSWSRKADIPLPPMGGVTGVIDGKLYVVTGYLAKGLFRYDPATDRWESLPSPAVDHFRGTGAVIKEKLYVVGGEHFGANVWGIRKLDVYDPATNAWSAKALMPRGVYEAAGARLQGQLYVMGGIGTNYVRRLVYAYDPATNTWAAKPSLPTFLLGFAASNFVLDGKRGIIAVGGGDANFVYTP